MRMQKCADTERRDAGSRHHQLLSKECAEALSAQNQDSSHLPLVPPSSGGLLQKLTDFEHWLAGHQMVESAAGSDGKLPPILPTADLPKHADKPTSSFRSEETWDYKTTFNDHIAYADGSFSDQRTSSDGTWSYFDHNVRANGSFIDITLDSSSGKTTVQHSEDRSGNFTDLTTKPDLSTETLVHRHVRGSSYIEVTSGSDGRQTTLRHDETMEGSYEEELTGSDGKVTRKQHKLLSRGGFLDTTDRPDGSRFIHSEDATGRYIEKDIDAKGGLRTPPITVFASTDREFARRVKESIAQLPVAERKFLADGGWRYDIADKVLDVEPQLSEKQPRGYASHVGFYDVGGINNVLTKEIIVGQTTTNGAAPRPQGLVDHETGHAIDTLWGSRSRPFSVGSEFDQAYRQDVAALSLDERLREPIPYLTQYDDETNTSQIAGKSEACAEVYGALHGSSSNKVQTATVLKDFPHVAALLRRKLDALNNGDSIDFAIGWPF